MIINKNKYPFINEHQVPVILAAESIKGNTNGPYTLLELQHALSANLHNMKQDALQHGNIMYVSKSLTTNLFRDNTREKLLTLKQYIKPETGMILLKGGASLLYTITNYKDEKEVGIKFYITMADRVLLGAYLRFRYCNNEEFRCVCTYSNGCHDSYDSNSVILSHAKFILLFSLFKEYAELETKVIQKGKVRKVKINKEKYITDSETPIKIFDSTWNTTTIRTDSFNVSGHFRIQPCGVDRSNKKLIWISDFKKQGYKRKAKMLAA